MSVCASPRSALLRASDGEQGGPHCAHALHLHICNFVIVPLLGAAACVQSAATNPAPSPAYLRVCLKYLKSGGAWSFLAGISSPSPLRK
jgi:hypothetical protein